MQIKEGWVRSLTPTTHIVLDEIVITNNPYIKNLIINHKLIVDNYNIVVNENEIKLSLKIMRERQKTKDFVNQGLSLDYKMHIDIHQYSTEHCTVEGRKMINENKITIERLNAFRRKEEKELGVKIDIEITDNGFIFMFEKDIRDKPDPVKRGYTVHWWDDDYEDEW